MHVFSGQLGNAVCEWRVDAKLAAESERSHPWWLAQVSTYAPGHEISESAVNYRSSDVNR